MEKIITKVDPIIIYPICILKTGMQNDCNTCLEKNSCICALSLIKITNMVVQTMEN